MEYLQNGYTLDIPSGCFPLSTDSILLANFVRLPKNAQVIDLASGCGTLGLLLCAKYADCTVTGIEIDKRAHEAAMANIGRNDLQQRLFSICADLRNIPADSVHCCISNPPYFSGGPASGKNPTARRQDHCSTEELFSAAGRCLRYGGDFYLVHKPDQLAALIICGAKHHLEAKQLRLIRHRADRPVNLILLQFRKGGKPGLIWDEKVLRDPDNMPSDYYKSLYHIKEV